jgi:hypothetical protein
VFKLPMRPLGSVFFCRVVLGFSVLTVGCAQIPVYSRGSAETEAVAGVSYAGHYIVMAVPTIAIKTDPVVQTLDDPSKKKHCVISGAVGQRIPLASSPVYSAAKGHYELRFLNEPCPLARRVVYVFRDQILVASNLFSCSSQRPTRRASTPQHLKKTCARPCFPGAVVRGFIDKKFCSMNWGEALTEGSVAPDQGRAFGDTSYTFDKLAGGHEGTDFDAHPAAEIRAIGDGAVVFAETRCTQGDSMCGNGYGNVVVVHNGKGMYSRYAHLQAGAQVLEGQFVRQGDMIGRVGSTGWSDKPHLHIEIGTMAAPLTACEGPYAFDKVYAYKNLFPKFRNPSTCM